MIDLRLTIIAKLDKMDIEHNEPIHVVNVNLNERHQMLTYMSLDSFRLYIVSSKEYLERKVREGVFFTTTNKNLLFSLFILVLI